MQEINNSYQKLYKQALLDPSKLSEEDLLQLIVRYPYSQPLMFAYEYHKKLNDEELPNKSLALLYASSSSWLWGFLNRPITTLTVDEDTEQLIDGYTSDDIVNDEEVFEEPDLQVIDDVDHTDLVDNESLELDILVNQGAIYSDYLMYDSESNELVIEESTESEPEDLSIYNDDLMPYSFRWWLYKTRLEHAENYQPFATVKFASANNANQVDFGKLDEAILEQQIKENIIHLQNPEDKLSEQVKSRPIEQVPPKRTDTIIDRFINKEPIIQPPLAEKLNNENMARQSAEDNYVLVTETLANIYIEQGLYLKSIEVFKKLILKYPEKKSYFATRIEEIKKNL